MPSNYECDVCNSTGNCASHTGGKDCPNCGGSGICPECFKHLQHLTDVLSGVTGASREQVLETLKGANEAADIVNDEFTKLLEACTKRDCGLAGWRSRMSVLGCELIRLGAAMAEVSGDFGHWKSGDLEERKTLREFRLSLYSEMVHRGVSEARNPTSPFIPAGKFNLPTPTPRG